MTLQSLDRAVEECLVKGKGIRMGIGSGYFYRSLYAVQLYNCFKVCQIVMIARRIFEPKKMKLIMITPYFLPSPVHLSHTLALNVTRMLRYRPRTPHPTPHTPHHTPHTTHHTPYTPHPTLRTLTPAFIFTPSTFLGSSSSSSARNSCRKSPRRSWT